DRINNDNDAWGGADSTPGKVDVLQFKAGVSVSDVKVSRSGDDLVLKINGTTDQVTVQSYFANDATSPRGYAIDQIRFNNGTTWDVATIKEMVMRASPGNDSLIGYATDDVINTGAGD